MMIGRNGIVDINRGGMWHRTIKEISREKDPLSTGSRYSTNLYRIKIWERLLWQKTDLARMMRDKTIEMKNEHKRITGKL